MSSLEQRIGRAERALGIRAIAHDDERADTELKHAMDTMTATPAQLWQYALNPDLVTHYRRGLLDLAVKHRLDPPLDVDNAVLFERPYAAAGWIASTPLDREIPHHALRAICHHLRVDPPHGAPFYTRATAWRQRIAAHVSLVLLETPDALGLRRDVQARIDEPPP